MEGSFCCIVDILNIYKHLWFYYIVVFDCFLFCTDNFFLEKLCVAEGDGGIILLLYTIT